MTNFEYLFEQLVADKKIELAYHKENGLEKVEVKDTFVVEETTANRIRSGFGFYISTRKILLF